MPLTTPPTIVAAGIGGAPISYTWNTSVADALRYPDEDEHARLAHAFEHVADAAALALTMALAEWIAWRFDGMVDVNDLLARAQAGFALAGSGARVSMARPDEPFPKTQTKVHGPLRLARMIVAFALHDFAEDPTTAAGWAFRMALLALHVQPDPAPLQRWLEAALRRTRAVAPDGGAASAVPPLPRAFFFGSPDVDDRALLAAHARQDADVAQRDGNPYIVGAVP
jgi:hypothetical protein